MTIEKSPHGPVEAGLASAGWVGRVPRGPGGRRKACLYGGYCLYEANKYVVQWGAGYLGTIIISAL